MKKQFLILATSIITVAIVSCSKNSADIPEKLQLQTEEPTAASRPGGPNVIDPLSVKLDGWFTFDFHLKDATGKLADGVALGAAAKYTTDRKGKRYSALKPDGSFNVKISKVPLLTATSISVWVKTADLTQNKGIVSGNSQGLFVVQNPDKFVGGLKLVPPGSISVTTALPKDVADKDWHHIALTYDGSSMKYYFDGALFGVSNMPGSINATLVDFIVANGFWKGAVDDLRFYSRTLTAAEVNKLFVL
jgi:hypothetical protein